MYEIKKIMPFSLAKYLSLLAGIIFLLSGIAQLVFSTNIQAGLIYILVTVIVACLFFWIVGYLFAIIYNWSISKTRGIIIDMDEINLESLNKIKQKNDFEKQEIKNEEEKDSSDKFVV